MASIHSKAPWLKRLHLPEPPEPNSAFPLNLPLFKDSFDLTITKPVLIISGENGSGKSTLIEAIAQHCGFNASGGSQNHLYGGGSKAENQLSKALRFAWLPKVTRGFFMRAESFFNFAGYLDNMAKEEGQYVYNAYGGSSLHEQSHGEAFLSLFNNRLTSQGIYLLDEPEAALSPMRQLSLLALLDKLHHSGKAQVIMATHSPILMSYPQAQFIYLKDGKITSPDWKETPHYETVRRFLERPGVYHKELFD